MIISIRGLKQLLISPTSCICGIKVVLYKVILCQFASVKVYTSQEFTIGDYCSIRVMRNNDSTIRGICCKAINNIATLR